MTLGRKSAIQKIAVFLLKFSRMAEFAYSPPVQPASNFPTFVVPITRTEMADYLGLTIETVSQNLAKLKSRNVIRLIDIRIIEICDTVELEIIAECKT